MKKVLIAVIALAFLAPVSNAIDIQTQFGSLVQNGSNPVSLWSLGIDTRIISVNDKGVTIVNESGALWGGEGAGEVMVFRTMIDAQKNILSNPIKDGEGKILDWSYRLYTITGAGGWKFIETGAEDKENLAYHIGLGFGLSGLDGGLDVNVTANCDIVRIDGHDLFFPHVSATIGL